MIRLLGPGPSAASEAVSRGFADATYALVGRALAAGTGLTGGGTLGADRTISLNAASLASLARADTAVQPAAITALTTNGRLGPAGQQINNYDLNGMTDAGFYSGFNLGNSPEGNTGFFYLKVQHHPTDTNYAQQIATLFDSTISGETWQRFLNGPNGWTSWVKISDAYGALDPSARFLSTETNNGELNAAPFADVNLKRPWLEIANDMGPTQYALDRLFPGISKALGAEQIQPTGTASDEVAINAALQRSSAVVLSGQYRLSSPIQVPSHTTLILKDAHVTLESGLTCNILTNSNLAVNGNSGIRVIGIGKAVFDGNAINQVRSTTESWRNVGVHWVGVTDFSISGITIRNTSNFSALHVGCSRGQWTNITLDQNRAVPNQDGIDFGPGNSYIYVDGVYGRVEDDCFSIFAKYSTGGGSVHPAFANGGDTHHLYISNVFLDTYRSLFRLQAAEGSSLHHIYADNINHTGVNRCQSFLLLGELKSAYVKGRYPDASGNEFYAIYMNHITGRTHAMLRLSSNVKDVYMTDLVSDNWGAIFTHSDADTASGTNINIDGVYTSYNGADSYGPIVELDTANHKADGVFITNMNLARCTYVTNSAMPVTNGKLTGIIGQVDVQMFAASPAVAFTGEVDLTVIKTPTRGTVPTAPGWSHYKNTT